MAHRTFAAVVVVCLIAAAAAHTAHHGVYRDTTSGAWSWRAEGGKSAPPPPLGTALVANATVHHTMNKVGWDALTVVANTSFPDADQAYAVGYVEGAATAQSIFYHYNNTVRYGNGFPTVAGALKQWVVTHIDWMETNAARRQHEPYWHQVGLVLRQLTGITDGYAAAMYGRSSGFQLSFFDIFMLNFQDEIGNVQRALNGGRQSVTKGFIAGGCSSFMKPTKDDVFMAHSTWGSLGSMLRVFKDVSVGYAPRVRFSSYPGYVDSDDDFYILDSNLTVTETTNSNFNDTLATLISPSSVAEFIRVVVANRMAVNGATWATTFCSYNSGTYNNQYMILDHNKITPGRFPLQPGTFHVLEQIPTYCEHADVTDVVNRQGFWSSYNIPYFPKVNELSMNAYMARHNGSWWDYHETTRAKMFRRGEGAVTDLAGMQFLMRYNNYTHDPLSVCATCSPPYSAALAIVARCDLDNKDTILNHPYCWQDFDMVGLDSKITSYRHLNGLNAGGQRLGGVAVSGPTNGNGALPYFSWSTFRWFDEGSYSHSGMPDSYAFPWVDLQGLFNGTV